MRRAMASGSLAVGGDVLVCKIAHTGSACAKPACRDAEERERVVWIESLDEIEKLRDEQPDPDTKTQTNDSGGNKVAQVCSLQCDTG